MDADAPKRLELTDVRFGYPNRPAFLGPVSVSVRRGECWTVIGPNGAGKSTLLRLMAGLLKPSAGRVTLNGRALTGLSVRQRARSLAFLPQQPRGDLDAAVRDVVLLGRFPHRSLGLFESAEDYRLAEQAMSVTQVWHYADRPLSTLSGGEAQRVHLAAALVQEPQILLLDEPTASLDLQHQLAILDILRGRLAQGLAVVVVTHDVNFAARLGSHVLLLDGGRVAAAGSTEAVLTPSVLEPVYGVQLASVDVPGAAGRRWVVPVSGTEGASA